MRPSWIRFTNKSRSNLKTTTFPVLCPGPALTRQVPRASLPEQGVTLFGAASDSVSRPLHSYLSVRASSTKRRSLGQPIRPSSIAIPSVPRQAPHSGGNQCAASGSVTPPSSLIPAHAPDQNPPVAFGFPYCHRSLQVVVSPCWKMALPDVISVSLSLRAWTRTPAALMVLLPVSSHKASAFPTFRLGRRFAISTQRLPCGDHFRSCSHSLMFRPVGLLATQVAPTVMSENMWQPWHLLPSGTRVVTFPCIGYANRLNRAIGGKGTRTPQNSQPCRLLPKR